MEFPNGVIPATLTPVKSDLSIDHKLLYEHCNAMLERGCHGIVLMGTTGEANAFSLTERKEALEQLVANGLPSWRIMVGTGLCSLPETVELSRHAVQHGVGGVLVMPPFYYRSVSDDGLFAYYRELVEGVNEEKLRVYLYHFPRMSGIDLSDALVERLVSAFPYTIVGMKDSSGDLEHMLRILDKYPGFRLYTGNELYLPEVLKHGGAGSISATMNYSAAIAAKAYEEILRTGSSSTTETMRAVRKAFSGYNFSAAVKGILTRITGNEGFRRLRPPLTELDDSDLDIIEKRLANAENRGQILQ